MRIRVHENMSELRERYVEPLVGDLLVRLNDEFLFAAEDLSGDIRVNVFLQGIPECTLADGVLSACTTVDFLAGGDVPADMEQVVLAAEDAVLEELRGDLPEGVSVKATGEPKAEQGEFGRGYTWRLRRDYDWNILIEE